MKNPRARIFDVTDVLFSSIVVPSTSTMMPELGITLRE